MEQQEGSKLNEKLLETVSKKIEFRWQQIGRELELKQAQLEVFKKEFPNDHVKHAHLMLLKWFTTCDPEKRTLKTLRDALEDAECTEAVNCLPSDGQ
ncbi:E3 ubiquitin-protein ligase MIB2-like isoform X2 [Octopus vulgaris]|uniref:E3 ubiquitin-protein ligase MIB2-like isoform X2 n=1 Tax=Octopus vulgaris TaxID=6645 RepID=A0AA36C2U1_OCTVU|nr:E3 ubiquitin-protein ligase MIB2-like isoform X2 [Octopus vulgaris]